MPLNRNRICSALAFVALAAVGRPGLAQHREVNDRMLESAVFIECDVEYRGETIAAGSGSGFLVANSEYVVTNHHVVQSCIPENKVAAF